MFKYLKLISKSNIEIINNKPSNSHEIAFTLAEVLITLGIIGVVAALTLPPLIKNINDKEYSTARKRVLSTIGEAVRRQAVVGELKYANNAEDYVENYLKTQLKIIKTCDNEHLNECGIETGENQIFNLIGQKTTMPTKISDLATGIATNGNSLKGKGDEKSYGLILQNGYSINLFYNPNCMSNISGYAQDSVCVNAIYDINGLSKPNQVGQDIGFVSILYPGVESIALAPEILRQTPYNSMYSNNFCTNPKGYSLPTLNEAKAIYFNSKILGFLASGYYWTKDLSGLPGNARWLIKFNDGSLDRTGSGGSWSYVVCVGNN